MLFDMCNTPPDAVLTGDVCVIGLIGQGPAGPAVDRIAKNAAGAAPSPATFPEPDG